MNKNILLDKLYDIRKEALPCNKCGHSSRPLDENSYNDAKRFIDFLIEIPNIKCPDIQQMDEYILFEWDIDDKFLHVEIRDKIVYGLYERKKGKYGGVRKLGNVIGYDDLWKITDEPSNTLILLIKGISK